MARRSANRGLILCAPPIVVLACLFASPARAQQIAPHHLDQLAQFSLERFKKLREVEKYQFKIAESYYREKRDWKVALAEYEKFLRLYERSEAAPYAQLMWSLCQVHLRRQNTAIKDGFQSVIDYWPDSPDAVAAAYFIGRTYKEMGDVRQAKKACREVLDEHPEHLVAVYATADLIDIAGIENDDDARVSLWKKLAFETKRDDGPNAHNSPRNQLCVAASHNLAAHSFSVLAFDDGVKALATSHPEHEIPALVLRFASGPIGSFTADAKTKAKGEKLADLAIAYIKGQVPADRSQPEEKQRALACWYCIADLHSAARRDDEVVRTYDEIGKLFGVDDGLLGRLANWYKSRGRYDEARATYGRFQDKVEGQHQVAHSFYQQNKFDEAALAWRQALALDPQNPVKWKPQIAEALRRGGKHPEAIAVYNELIAEDAERPGQWRWQIAWTLQHFAGKYEEAVAVYRQCEDHAPQNYFRMAECRRAQKQHGKAVALYDLVIGSEPDHAAAAWWQKAMTYREEEWNKKELEIKSLQHICRRYPKSALASQAHTRLQSVHKITVTLGGAKDE